MQEATSNALSGVGAPGPATPLSSYCEFSSVLMFRNYSVSGKHTKTISFKSEIVKRLLKIKKRQPQISAVASSPYACRH